MEEANKTIQEKFDLQQSISGKNYKSVLPTEIRRLADILLGLGSKELSKKVSETILKPAMLFEKALMISEKDPAFRQQVESVLDSYDSNVCLSCSKITQLVAMYPEDRLAGNHPQLDNSSLDKDETETLLQTGFKG